MSSADQQTMGVFMRFFYQLYADETSELAKQYPEGKQSLVFDRQDLAKFNEDLAVDLLA